jgi:hypothetical protein
VLWDDADFETCKLVSIVRVTLFLSPRSRFVSCVHGMRGGRGLSSRAVVMMCMQQHSRRSMEV